MSFVPEKREKFLQASFLQVCSMKRLEGILGSEERAVGFLSDFVLVADKQNDKDLANLAKCAVEVASMNLSILKQLGQAYLVPRGGVINVEIGYRGWELLAKRMGILCRCYPVFEGDFFEIENEDFNQKVRFKPLQENLEADKTPEFINQKLKFFVVTTKDTSTGVINSTIINTSLLKRIQSKGAGGGAYKDWLFEMYQAKAIKYALRKLPLENIDPSATRGLAIALEADDRSDTAFESIEASKGRRQIKNSEIPASLVKQEVKQEAVEEVKQVVQEAAEPVDGEVIDFESLI